MTIDDSLFYLDSVQYADMSPEDRRVWRFLNEWRAHVDAVRPVLNEVGTFREMLRDFGLTVKEDTS